jgi:DNA-binding protein Fis
MSRTIQEAAEEKLDEKLESMSFEELVLRRLAPLIDKLGGAPIDDLYRHILAQVERPLIALALEKTRGNQIQAAQLLGINRNTLRKKMTELDVASLVVERQTRHRRTLTVLARPATPPAQHAEL